MVDSNTGYFESGSARAYMKLDETNAAVVHECAQRNSRDWGLLLSFNQRPPGVYFGLMANLRTPALSVDASLQPSVIPTYASIQIGNTQSKCVCTTPGLFGKWLEKSGSSKNSKVIWQTSMEYFLEKVC